MGYWKADVTNFGNVRLHQQLKAQMGDHTASIQLTNQWSDVN